MLEEMRYERLRPAQIVAARQACPVVYIPLGTLEWHGVHNPVGLDTLKAHALALRCARATGGLVFPPLWYGESRVEGLMEATAADHDQIAEGMGLPSENFSLASSRFSPQEQYENCQRLLIHILAQAQSLGFRLAVLVPGHYPLLDHARVACAQYHQMRWNGQRGRLMTWVFCEYELVQDKFPGAGDHAGFWETSLLLALEPELVDVSLLPADRTKPPVGIVTNQPVQDASAEIGEKAIRLIVERVSAQVSDRLRHPERYYMHGWRS